jgi:hypothetical protein
MPADLEDFSPWLKVEHETKRYRKRTVRGYTLWICEEPSAQGFGWWIVYDLVGTRYAESSEELAPPPPPIVYPFQRAILTPAQLQAMLDPVIENFWRIALVRKTGEVPMVQDPSKKP